MRRVSPLRCCYAAKPLALDQKAMGDPAQHRKVGSTVPIGVRLVRWLRGADAQEQSGALWWRRATVMLQREVAERVAAPTGSKAYGRLAVLAQRRADSQILFDVSPKAFSPPPKVVSSILSITPLPKPRFETPIEKLERVTAAAFSQRRKMLRSSLKSISADPEALLRSAEIEPTSRAENLSPEQFAHLASLWRE